MSTLAATTALAAATHGDSLAGLIPAAIAVLLMVTAGYFAKCWLFPFTTCRHLSARGSWHCRRCEGTGRRVRAGRRLINHVRATRRR